jgi:hypothetical protein
MVENAGRNWLFYLSDMLEFAEKIICYTEGIEQDSFTTSGAGLEPAAQYAIAIDRLMRLVVLSSLYIAGDFMDTSRNNVLQALASFRAASKFLCTEPEFRHLNPSPASVTQPLEATLNQCATDLSLLVQADAPPAKLKKCIAASLYSVEKPFDTEDREYFAYYFNQLGQCVGLNIGHLLNEWLYGFVLSKMLRLFSRR